MNPEIVILSEISQTQEDKYHTISLICGILRKGTYELIYKRSHGYRKQTLGYGGGKGERGINGRLAPTCTYCYL